MGVETASPLASRGVRTAGAEHGRSLLRTAWSGVAALTVLAAAIRFYRIGHQGFWYDEATTALLVHFSPGQMLGLIPQSESTPPLYYCIAWVWVRVFGNSEAGLRSLSALAGVAVVPVLYAATARLASVRTGLIAAALAACSPLLIWYSQEARAYELLVLLSAVSLLGFTYLLEHPSGRSAAAWAVPSALALATEYYAILVLIPEALWLLYRHRRSRPVQAAIGFMALWGLALIPLVLRENQNGLSHWIARYSLARRIKQVVPQFVIGFGSPAYAVLEPLALALAVFGVLLLLTRRAGLERRGAFVAGALAFGGLVLNLLLVAAGIDDLLTRNMIALWIPAAIVLCAGFALAPRLLGVLAATALCVIGLAAAVGVAQDRNLQRPDWRAVAALLGKRPTGAAAKHGRVILVQNYKDALPLPLYLPGLAFIPTHHARASEVDIISLSAPRGEFCWWGSACNLKPSRMQSSYQIPGFRPVWRRRVLQFTVLHMVAVHGTALVRATQLERTLTTTTIHQDGLMYQP